MIDELRDFGLNDNEIKIYLELLKQESSTASNLAKLSKVNRTTAYLELENLMKLGLVSYVVKNSKRYYQASSPDKLTEILDLKKAKIESVIPQLRALHSSVTPFKIEVFEGKDGIRTFYQDVLNSSKEFLAFGVTGRAMEILEFEYPHFLKKFIDANVKERAIANVSAKKNMSLHPRSHLKIKYFPEEYSADVTTVIYDDKVAIQSLEKDNIYVIIIKDKLLHDTYKNHFNFMWKSIK